MAKRPTQTPAASRRYSSGPSQAQPTLTIQAVPLHPQAIESTDAAIKRQTASSSYKPATLENGIKIMVPPFISADDKIVLDTRTLEYIKKIK